MKDSVFPEAMAEQEQNEADVEAFNATGQLPAPCGFGVGGGECYACEITRAHSEGCKRRYPVTGHCSCIVRAAKQQS